MQAIPALTCGLQLCSYRMCIKHPRDCILMNTPPTLLRQTPTKAIISFLSNLTEQQYEKFCWKPCTFCHFMQCMYDNIKQLSSFDCGEYFKTYLNFCFNILDFEIFLFTSSKQKTGLLIGLQIKIKYVKKSFHRNKLGNVGRQIKKGF